jgi:hypothetical protein
MSAHQSSKMVASIVEDGALDWLRGLCHEILSGLVLAPGEIAAERSDYKQVFLFDRLQTNLEDLNKALRDAMLPMPPSGELRVPSVLEKMSTAN